MKFDDDRKNSNNRDARKITKYFFATSHANKVSTSNTIAEEF